MNDGLGLIFIVLLGIGAFVALRVLANPRPRTADEFERSAAENPTMVGALLNALHDVTDPGAARGKEVRMQMKDGRFQKKKREGKADGPETLRQENEDDGNIN